MPTRERSVKQMVSRVAGTIADWGRERGYFAAAEDGDSFEAELSFILAVDDTMLDIDHPDLREFIWCKAKEEDKAAALCAMPASTACWHRDPTPRPTPTTTLVHDPAPPVEREWPPRPARHRRPTADGRR